MSREEAKNYVKKQVKKLFYYTNQQNTYVEIEQEKNNELSYRITVAKDSMDVKGAVKIYLYCMSCGIKKQDVQEAIDKDASFFGCNYFCDGCHCIWLDLWRYSRENNVKMPIYEYLYY